MTVFNVPAPLTSASLSMAFAFCSRTLTRAGQRLGNYAASRCALTAAATAVALAAAAHPAAAQTVGGTGSLDSFLTNVVNMITGPTGQAIAIIAVALCGLGAMFGALSARTFGGVVLGCGMVFSAAWIVGKITGSGT